MVSRGLLGWNVAVWLYLALLATMMARADHRRLRQVADRQAESAGTVLALVSVAAVVSLLGTVLELGAAKQMPGTVALPHVALALITVLGAMKQQLSAIFTTVSKALKGAASQQQ